MLVFTCYIMIYGILSSLGAIYSNLATLYDYSMQSNSMCCLLFLFGGILNSFFLGSILDKYQCYKKLMIIISALSLATNLMHFGSLPFHNTMIEAFVMLLTGMSVVPITSVAYVFSVELAFPVPEALTNGMMITVGLIWSTSVGFMATTLMESNPVYALTLWSLMSLVSLITSFFVQEDLRRLKQDEVKNSEYLEEDEVRRQSFEQREVFLKEAGLETLQFRFEFDQVSA